MRARLSRWIAFGAGAGLSRAGPGTVGTLVAWAVWAWGLAHWRFEAQALLVIVSFGIGVWACQRVADDLRIKDHPAIVWDEIVAFWLVLMVVPHSYGSQFVAFLLFRFFDIVKPPPIRQIDASVPGGFGVMLDDLAAAFATILLMVILPH
ncbi:MAG: phosphatidylglycerophosphatase A [Burkholderiaceae bacterium]